MSNFKRQIMHFAGKGLLLTISFMCVSLASAQPPWQPIVGIPEPSFGVNEVAPTRPADWSVDAAGFYYVDFQTGSDSGNTLGNETTPRKTIPSPIPAGSYVEVHGSVNGDVTIVANGTAMAPVFVRGQDEMSRPVFQKLLYVHDSSYLIIEQIKTEPFDSNVGNGSSGIRVRERSDHVAIRDSEISGVGNLNRTGNVGIGTYNCYGLSMGDSDYCAATDFADNIVLDNLQIHDIGDFDATADQDGHGVVVNGQVSNMWLVNSTMTNGSGDGIQIEARHDSSLVNGTGGKGGNERIHHIYVGGNTSWHNRQTGYWIKHAHDVVIASNVAFDFVASTVGSEGQCTGYQYSADYFWFVNNTLYDCREGIKAQSVDDHMYTEGGAFYIGNLIYDITSSTPDNPNLAGGITIRANSRTHTIINNTIVNADIGISGPINGGEMHMYNNLIANSRSGLGVDIYMESVSANSTLDDTLFYASTGSAMIRFNGNNRSIATLQAASANTFGVGVQCLNCIEGDPLFTDGPNKDFTITGNSPARNSGTAQAAFDTFQSRYGVSIKEDIEGRARPLRSVWDMGALEADEELRPVPPSNVTATTVVP